MAEDGEVTLQMRGDDGVPLVLGHVEQHPLAQDPGHGHDPVDPSPPLDGGVHDPFTARHRAHVLGDGQRLAAGRLTGQRAGPADAASGSGDDHGLAVEEPCHLLSSGDLASESARTPTPVVAAARTQGQTA